MSTFKRTKVVMLPVERGNIIKKWNKLYYAGNDIEPVMGGSAVNQALYFLSDDEIKEGDWYKLGNTIKQAKANLGKPDKGKYCKIIATTDRLYIGIESIFNSYTNKYLPEPSQGFIKKYCEKGGINEVMLEYEHQQCKYFHTGRSNYQLKVSSDNTITIRPVKDSWNYEEMAHIAINYAINCQKGYQGSFDDWFKKNL